MLRSDKTATSPMWYFFLLQCKSPPLEVGGLRAMACSDESVISGYVAHHIHQQLPEFLSGLDADGLFGGMGSFDGGAKGDHIQPGIFLKEEPAFQAGMNGLYLGIGMKKMFIGVAGDLHDLRVGVGLPTGVACRV